jgi:antirestriction protein ArdC
MLCGFAGIAPARIEQSAAYIASWLQVLRDDRRMVVSAAQQAQRAVDHIRNEQPSEAESINGEAASEASDSSGSDLAGTAR